MNRSPLFPFLLLFGSTIVLSFYSNLHEYLPEWLLFMFMLLLIVFSVVNQKYLKSKVLTYLSLTGFIVVFGTFIMHSKESDLTNWSTDFLEYNEVIIGGEVSSEPVVKNEQVRFELLTSYILSESEAKKQSLSEKLIVYVKEGAGDMQLGDQVILKGRLSEIKNKGNPSEFDYAMFMLKKGVKYQVFTNQEKCLKVGELNNSIFIWANKARNQMIKIIDQFVEESEAPIAKAILLGYKNDIDSETRSHYAASGASHILAVSGMHVGILVLIISYINKLWARTERLKVVAAIFSLIIIWSFVFLTGFAPSIVRSGFMFSLLLIGNLLQRTPSPLNIISLSAFFLLIIEPLYIFDVGFQLSFSAIFGIFYIYPKLNKRFFIKNRILRWLYQLSLVSISAQIATLPFTLFYFKQFPTYFLLSNPISTIGATLILVLGVLFFISSFSDVLVSFFGKLLSYIIYGQNYIMEKIADFKFSLFKIHGVGWYESLLLVLLVIVLFFLGSPNKRKSILMKGVAFIAIVVALFMFQPPRSNGQIIVFNSKSDNLLIELKESSYFLQSEETSKELKYYLENNTQNNLISLKLDDNFCYKGVLNIADQKVLILSKENNNLLGQINADIILCTSSCYLPKEFNSDALWVLPNSLSSKQHRIIEQLLIDNDQTYFDVSKNGAFKLKL